MVEAGSKHVEEDGATAGRGMPPAGNGGRHEAAPAEIAKGILIHSLDPRFTFEDFIVGKPNELAYAGGLPGRRTARPCRSTRCSSMAASASARPT